MLSKRGQHGKEEKKEAEIGTISGVMKTYNW